MSALFQMSFATHTPLPANTDMLDVLVVDDHAISRTVLAEALRPLGCRVQQADSAATTLADVRLQRYRIIFIDLMMPEIDGYGLARRIRDIELTRALPPTLLIAYSGTLYAEDGKLPMLEMMKIYRHGFNDGLTKPVDTGQLREIVGAGRASFTAEPL